MKIARDPEALGGIVQQFRASNEIIGFVPTMGALHKGHLSLVEVARAHAHRVVVSIFVNPTQFGPDEDYLRYPRPEGEDLRLLEDLNVDLAYLPSVSVMYQPGSNVTVDPGPVGGTFEGKVRPDHFRGVLTIVAKLIHQVDPDLAVFGQKDAQQLFLVRKMIRDLNFLTKIVEGETVRDPDGLAMSSRNTYLKSAERLKAPTLYKALNSGKTVFDKGVRSLARVNEAMMEALPHETEVQADYLTVVSEETFTEVDPVPESARVIGAIRMGSVRLIDNLPLKVK